MFWSNVLQWMVIRRNLSSSKYGHVWNIDFEITIIFSFRPASNWIMLISRIRIVAIGLIHYILFIWAHLLYCVMPYRIRWKFWQTYDGFTYFEFLRVNVYFLGRRVSDVARWWISIAVFGCTWKDGYVEGKLFYGDGNNSVKLHFILAPCWYHVDLPTGISGEFRRIDSTYVPWQKAWFQYQIGNCTSMLLLGFMNFMLVFASYSRIWVCEWPGALVRKKWRCIVHFGWSIKLAYNWVTR